LFLHLFRKILVPQFQKLIQETTGQNVSDFDLSGAQRIQKEEELSHRRANVKAVEALLQAIQLR
jgi:hypothetical protein